MKIKTNVKAGGINLQHNQTVARGLKVKTNAKAGDMMNQHNQTMAQDLRVKTDVKARATTGEVRVGSGSSLTAARGLKVKTGIKAGPPDPPIIKG